MQGGYTIKKKMGRGDMSVSPKTEIDGENDITTPQNLYRGAQNQVFIRDNWSMV